MNLEELCESMDEEASTILGSKFSIEITNTTTVPHNSDSSITFANVDDGIQRCKKIETCVLYIDIRRSTELNMSHKQVTVAKLYSAFVRTMSRSARHFGGHVRGIIGDRVMVIFDQENCFVRAMETAILMNSTAKYIINKYFSRDEVSCGIGIDHGSMLVTKTGIRKKGEDQGYYNSLVWLGRPANVASKLTDIANKPGENIEVPAISLMVQSDSLVPHVADFTADEILPFARAEDGKLVIGTDSPVINVSPSTRNIELKQRTPPILMTEKIFEAYFEANGRNKTVKTEWYTPQNLEVSGYQGRLFGADVIYTYFANR